MTVDKILATGMYTDRRGRTWHYLNTIVDYDRWPRWEHYGAEDLILEASEMRLLIERDMHECDGFGELPDCQSHPVPIVIVGYDEGEWADFRVRFRGSSATYSSHRAAMDAARALAVGE